MRFSFLCLDIFSAGNDLGRYVLATIGLLLTYDLIHGLHLMIPRMTISEFVFPDLNDFWLLMAAKDVRTPSA
jgi:hypothetical protein